MLPNACLHQVQNIYHFLQTIQSLSIMIFCSPKEAAAALKKRLSSSGRNFHQISLALTVLETCVKNCGYRFHCKIAQRDFLAELTKIIQKKVSTYALYGYVLIYVHRLVDNTCVCLILALCIHVYIHTCMLVFMYLCVW